MLGAMLLAGALAAADPCVGVDARGTFATCFDPGNRLELGAGATSAGALTLEGGVQLRRSRESRSHEHVAWSTEHALGETQLVRQGASWRGEGTAYDGLFLRHLDEGFLLVPTKTPLRVPFPFDVAVEARLGTAERDAEGRERLEVGRAGLLLDVARDPTGMRRLAFGPSLAYALERENEAAPAHPLVQPLTGGTLLARLESDSGLWSAQARVDAGWELARDGSAQRRAEGSAHLERVLFAINDQPFALQLSAHGLLRSGMRGEGRLTLALVAAYEL